MAALVSQKNIKPAQWSEKGIATQSSEWKIMFGLGIPAQWRVFSEDK
jgi:hypothetical protein